MAKILFYDTECNSLDKEGGYIQELAWACFDVTSKRLLYAKSSLIKWNLHYVVQPDAFQATGLTREFCELEGSSAGHILGEFLSDAENVQYIGGHNHAEFDDMMLSHCTLRALFSWPTEFLKIPRIDTMHDCPYPARIKIKALKYLALDHGFVMTNAHEALADVMACAHILFCYPFDQCLEIAETPFVNLFAHTDYHDKVGRELCYKNKFYWNRENRRFEKRTRKFFLAELQSGLQHVEIHVENETLYEEEQRIDPQMNLPTVTNTGLPF